MEVVGGSRSHRRLPRGRRPQSAGLSAAAGHRLQGSTNLEPMIGCLYRGGWAQSKGSANLEPMICCLYRGGWAQAGVLRKKESFRFLELGTAVSEIEKKPTKPSVFCRSFLRYKSSVPNRAMISLNLWGPNSWKQACVPNRPDLTGPFFEKHGRCAQPMPVFRHHHK